MKSISFKKQGNLTPYYLSSQEELVVEIQDGSMKRTGGSASQTIEL